ncbi:MULTISPECIES: SIR2 family protein [Methanosarcina]|uniref:Uncharacterized protein n=2 Tax=Methanosarcina barkeri TaxID=2208 RepID=A0A0E3LN06_METBA|nr:MULTISPECIES: SIR2 family protein [Methanosarcina]AKB53936.1 hypothetical protein MSBRM_0938 [Methanosarcina barkeri MS]
MSNKNTGSMYAENILLLGAGFTKNFGGLLASEMWAEIFNNEKIQAQPRIKKLMLNNFDYESVYYSVLEGLEDKESLLPTLKFKRKEKDAIQEATKAAYDTIDETLLRRLRKYPEIEWIHNTDTLFFNFGNTKNKSFIFTLNQDLFIERFYQNPLEPRDPTKIYILRLCIPGIDKYPVWYMNRDSFYDFIPFSTDEEREQFYNLKKEDYYLLPNEDVLNSRKENLLKKESYFLIKLHGSYNWISSNGSKSMVIGRGKTEQINNEPLLRFYFDTFKEVLSQDKRRLLVIGYGFGDEHINSVISNAVKNHGLKIYILSPESPKSFKEKLCDGCGKSKDIINIWNGVSGYFQCVEDVLLKDTYGNQSEKEHFYNVFFGKNNWKL